MSGLFGGRNESNHEPKIETSAGSQRIHSQYDYDFFLAHSSKNREQVEKFLEKVEHPDQNHQNIRCCYSPRDFPVGHFTMDCIVKCINASFKILAFISKDFLNSPYCKIERELAFQRAMCTDGDAVLIPILLDDVEKEDLPENVQLLNHVKVTDDKFVAKILNTLKVPNLNGRPNKLYSQLAEENSKLHRELIKMKAEALKLKEELRDYKEKQNGGTVLCKDVNGNLRQKFQYEWNSVNIEAVVDTSKSLAENWYWRSNLIGSLLCLILMPFLCTRYLAYGDFQKYLFKTHCRFEKFLSYITYSPIRISKIIMNNLLGPALFILSTIFDLFVGFMIFMFGRHFCSFLFYSILPVHLQYLLSTIFARLIPMIPFFTYMHLSFCFLFSQVLITYALINHFLAPWDEVEKSVCFESYFDEESLYRAVDKAKNNIAKRKIFAIAQRLYLGNHFVSQLYDYFQGDI